MSVTNEHKGTFYNNNLCLPLLITELDFWLDNLPLLNLQSISTPNYVRITQY